MGIEITAKSGLGLLDARALWAIQVGPARVALAQRRTAMLGNERGVLVAENIGTADCYVFVAVAIPHSAAVNPLLVMFSNSDQMGQNNAAPAYLFDSMVAGGATTPFYQLLMPGEQLYCQIADTAVAQQMVIVAQEMF